MTPPAPDTARQLAAGDIETAQAIIAEGRASHVAWAAHLRHCPGCDECKRLGIDWNWEREQAWVDKYDHLSRVLAALAAAEAPPRIECPVTAIPTGSVCAYCGRTEAEHAAAEAPTPAPEWRARAIEQARELLRSLRWYKRPPFGDPHGLDIGDVAAALSAASAAGQQAENEACATVAREHCESAYAMGNREAEDTAERIEAAIRARQGDRNSDGLSVNATAGQPLTPWIGRWCCEKCGTDEHKAFESELEATEWSSNAAKTHSCLRRARQAAGEER